MFRMFTDAKAYSAAGRSKPNDAGETGPLLPTYLDVFQAYLTNPKAAAAIRAALEDAAKKDKPISQLLDGSLGDFGDKLDAVRIDAVFAREKLKDKTDKTKSVTQFAAATDEVLTAALKKAFDLIKTHAPDEIVEASAVGGKPAWFKFAETQLDPPTKEGDPVGDARIIKYFDFTDFGPPKPTSSKTAWCGAFVAACMANSGMKDSIPKGAAAAENWKTWGDIALPVQSTDIPVGAVVVLAPAPNTDSTGHVGFFDKRLPDGRFQLLGGNQGNEVARTPFPASSVVAVRWLKGVEAGGAIEGIAAAKFNMDKSGVPKSVWKFADLIVDRFSSAGFSAPVQLATALANAIKESGLDPTLKSASAEQSFGLFQCNRTHGLGKGFSEDQLRNPETNISIILGECRKLPRFKNATSVEQAMDVFVNDIERPLDREGAIAARSALAKLLLK